MNGPLIKVEYAVVLCKWGQWAWRPRFARSEGWPRLTQFHFLFLYWERRESVVG